MNRLGRSVSILALSLVVPLAAADFLPLENGNHWTYRDAVTGSSFTVRVETPVVVNQKVYYSLRGYTPDRLLVRVNEYGNLVHYNEDNQAELMITAFELAGGAQFEAHKRECPEWGRAQEKRSAYSGPAGRWSVLDIQYQPYGCADAGDLLEQFAENIGMVRRVVNTIAGPRTYDLVQAQVGNQTIDTENRGSFSVTVTQGRDRGTWIATLRLNLRPVPSIKVTFPASQEYDVKLRDESGRILWTWSADKLFLQAIQEKTLNDGWSAQVEIPQPPATPEQPHRYIVEAFLTTARDQPQFAAVAVVETAGLANAQVRAGRTRR